MWLHSNVRENKQTKKKQFGTCHEFYRTREMPLLPTAQCGVGKTMLQGFPCLGSVYCDLLCSCPIVFLVFVGPELGAGVRKLVLRPNPPCHQFLINKVLLEHKKKMLFSSNFFFKEETMILTSSLLNLVPKETTNSQNQTLNNYWLQRKYVTMRHCILAEWKWPAWFCLRIK